MENIDEPRLAVGSPTTAEGNGGAEAVPPPSSSAQGDLVVETGATGAVMPSEGHTVVGNEEREREREGDGGSGDLAVSSGGGDPATETVVAGGDAGGDGVRDSSGGSGLGVGDDTTVSERVEERDGETVEVHDVDSDDSEETDEERETGGGSGGDRAEGASGVPRTRGLRWRIEARLSQQPSRGDKGKAAVIGGESTTQRPSDGSSAQGR